MCYGHRVDGIGVAGNVSDSFIASISSADPISTILLNGAAGKAVANGVKSKMRPHKLHIFAVAASSSMELEEILIRVKNSRWWNHMAQFYIFDSSPKAIGCGEASKFLWTAWTMDILGAKFICNPRVEEPVAYTFNPYTRDAPAPWKIERTQKGARDHPWTLFVRKFDENLQICDNIDFDQTRDVGRYVARMTSSECQPNSNDTNGITKYKLHYKILWTYARYIKLRFEMVCHSKNESVGFVDNEGKVHGPLKDLTEGRSEIMPYPRPLEDMKHLDGAYPTIYARFFAVTQYTSYRTQWRKVITAIDRPARIALCVVILLNVIFLKYILRQSFLIAILNTFRIICNSCLPKLPDTVGPRIYLACLFCFVVTIQALYQGQLSGALAQHVRYPNINNRRDLILSRHKIYGYHEDSAIFDTEIFQGRFVAKRFRSRKCTDYVLADPSIACVGFRDLLINDTIESKLHMSTNSVYQAFMFWPNRKDWPLQEKSSRHNFHYVESGIADHHQKMVFEKSFRILDANENEDSGQKFKVLTLDDLGFAFTILGFGLTCATLSFVIELLSLERERLPRVKYRARCPGRSNFSLQNLKISKGK